MPTTEIFCKIKLVTSFKGSNWIPVKNPVYFRYRSTFQAAGECCTIYVLHTYGHNATVHQGSHPLVVGIMPPPFLSLTNLWLTGYMLVKRFVACKAGSEIPETDIKKSVTWNSIISLKCCQETQLRNSSLIYQKGLTTHEK